MVEAFLVDWEAKMTIYLLIASLWPDRDPADKTEDFHVFLWLNMDQTFSPPERIHGTFIELGIQVFTTYGVTGRTTSL